MHVRSLFIAGVLLLVSACASTPESSGSGEIGPQEPALLFSCGAHAFSADLVEQPAVAEQLDHPAAHALRAFLTDEPTLDAAFLPDRGWHLAGLEDRRASFVAAVRDDPPFVEVSLERRDDGWRVAGWGQCRPRLELDGLGAARWTYEPGHGAPAADATSFVALVTEMACASGRPADGRIVGPAVIAGETEILVVFGVRPLEGGQDCPSNPPSRVVVELAEPVGGRVILDGGVLPPGDPTQPWP